MSGEDYIPTQYEIEVLRAVVKYGTAPAAAEVLCMSPNTVEFHLKALRRKTGLHHLPQLAVWAAEHGWLRNEEGGG